MPVVFSPDTGARAFTGYKTTLPLLDVNFDIEVGRDVAVETQFPPQRFLERNRRIDLLYRLWQGDLTQLVESHADIMLPINYFRRTTTIIVEALMQSVPEAPLDLRDLAAGGLRDMHRFGGALLWGGVNAEGEPFLTTVLPEFWYPRDDGGHLLFFPFISSEAQTVNPDRAELIQIDPDGTTTLEVREWATGRFRPGGFTAPVVSGNQVGRVVQAAEQVGFSAIEIAPRDPVVGVWGTSAYLDLASPVLAQGLLYSRANRALQGAWSTWYVEDTDAAAQFPVDETGKTPAQIRTARAEELQDHLDDPALRLPNEAVKVEALSFQGNLSESRALMERGDQIINTISSVPSTLDRNQIPMSGTALKLYNAPFYNATNTMQATLLDATNRLLEFIYGVPDLAIWPHYYDTFGEPEAPAPASGDPPAEEQE